LSAAGLPEALAQLGVDALEVKPKWHPNSGYRVPATPGFYVNCLLPDDEGEATDIHVYVE
jgi:hypothetical protein